MPVVRKIAIVIVSTCWWGLPAGAWSATGQLELQIEDHDSGDPLTARLHLTDGRGRTRRPKGLTCFADHCVVKGSAVLTLPPGTYSYVIERGFEYRIVSGDFVIQRGAADSKTIRLPRIVDMSKLGWWSGDLFVQRAGTNLVEFMRADDLHVAAVFLTPGPGRSPTTDQDDLTSARLGTVCIETRNRVIDAGGGRLNCYGLEHANEVPVRTAEYPSSAAILDAARPPPRTQVAAGWASAWDLPLWLASGQIDSLMVVGPEQFGMSLPGKPRDRTRFPGRRGLARWHQSVYFHHLNAGLRLTPIAGSGSGPREVPLGANRVYVHLEGPFNYESWWKQLAAGRVMLTNGPLLIPRVNGKLPGHTFRGPAGRPITLHISLTLHTAVTIPYLEIIQNGKIVREVMLDDWARQQGQLPEIEFQESGWLAIRAANLEEDDYRVALTGPYFVEIGGAPILRREAAEIFREWEYERIIRLRRTDDPHLEEILRPHRKAYGFWKQRAVHAAVE